MRVSRDLYWGATSTSGDAVTYAVLVRLRKTLCAVSPPPRLRARTNYGKPETCVGVKLTD